MIFGRPHLLPLAGLSFIALAGCALAAPETALCQPDMALFPEADVAIRVEIADDPAERAQGLMNREELAAKTGMLFIYETPRPASFWMKNTLIPLDMIFADEAGRVTRVHANAVPLDRTPIDGGDGVRFVLEINGGLAAKLGIAPGAELRHPAIGPEAAWPCAE
jgi:uncharacterized membrane protein (UPF0127 family)